MNRFVEKALMTIGLELPNTFKYICENKLSDTKLKKLISQGNCCTTMKNLHSLEFIKFSSTHSFEFLLEKLSGSIQQENIFLALSIVNRLHLSKPSRLKIEKLWGIFPTVNHTKELYTLAKNINLLFYSLLLQFDKKLTETIYRPSISQGVLEYAKITISTFPVKQIYDLEIDIRMDSEKDIDELLNCRRDIIQFPFKTLPKYKTVFTAIVNSCKLSTTFVRCRTFQDEKASLILCGIFGVEETNFYLECRGMKKVSKKVRVFINEWKDWENVKDYGKLVNGIATKKFTVERILRKYKLCLGKYLTLHKKIKSAKSMRERQRLGTPIFPDILRILDELPKFKPEETKKEIESISLLPLENSYISPILIQTNHTVYSSVDHYLLSQKYAGMFANPENLEFCKQIKDSKLPIVHPLPNYLQTRPDWDDIKDELLEKVLISKFINNNYMEMVLLSTGDEKLKLRSDDKRWDYKGKNLLNILLQKLRTQIKLKKGTNDDKELYKIWYYTFDSKDTRWKKHPIKIPKSRDSCEDEYYYFRNATKKELEMMSGGDGKFCYARQRSKHPTIITEQWVFKGPYQEDDETLSLVYHRSLKLKYHKAKFIPRVVIRGYNGMYLKSPNVLKKFPNITMKSLNGKEDGVLVPIMEKKNNTRVEFRKGVKIAFADKAAWTEKDLEKARKIMSNNPDKINGLSDNAWENILHYMACCHFLSVKNC